MKHLIIGTAGHVDHGKTTLIKALTDIDCDTHKQEKDRGITINLGFAHLDLPGGESVGIIDVPGHKDFIRTMVAGAFGIDIVMLVIAADSGIMPQTREHLDIIETLGVNKGIVVLTKCDLVDEEMLELAKLEVTEYLEGTVFEDAPVIGVSGLSGEGIEELRSGIGRLFGQIEQRKGSGVFRLYVDRLFNVKGIGFVVTGTVLDGKVKQADEVFLLPGKNKKLKVKGIQRHGISVEEAIAGDRAALNLSGLKAEDFQRGMLLAGEELEPTDLIDASLIRFNNEGKIGIWSNVIFYAGTFESMARMHLIDEDQLEPGNEGIVQLHLEQPAVLMNGDKFIIRNSSNDLTLGGGIIIDVSPLHHKKRTPKLVLSLQALAEATGKSDRLIDLISIELIKSREPLKVSELAAKLKKKAGEISNEIRSNPSESIVMYQDDELLVISNEHDRAYQDGVMEEIETWHKKYPILETGLDNREISGKLGFAGSDTGKIYTSLLMKKIHKQGLVKEVEGTWASAGHVVKVDNKIKGELEWLEDRLSAFGMDRPLMKDLEALALEQGIRKERLKMLLTYLGKEDKVYFFENDFIYNPILDQARTKLLKYLSDKAEGINEKQLRDLLGATKKMSQVLISIFINEGVIEKKTFYVHITEKGKQSL
jgi:selenocysteine-specific elongation factor